MGLFQFMKDMGEKISGGKPDGAAIEEKIREDMGSQIIEIKAEMEGEIVTLSGLCESQAAREKAVLIAGNLKGVSGVSYFGLKVKEAAVQAEIMPEEMAEAANDGQQAEIVAGEEAETAETEDVVEAEETEALEAEFYTIVSGDTLSKIAKKFYGDANKYPQVFEANREVIKDADKIYVGQTIRIPKITS